MENKKPIEITPEQHTALPDDEKGKYREVWQIQHTKSWSDLRAEEVDIYVNSNATTRQVFRLIEQPVEEKKDGVAWIDVKNELPKIGLPVLVHMNGRVSNKSIFKVDELISESQWRFTSDGFITHWMHLPTPPKIL